MIILCREASKTTKVTKRQPGVYGTKGLRMFGYVGWKDTESMKTSANAQSVN